MNRPRASPPSIRSTPTSAAHDPVRPAVILDVREADEFRDVRVPARCSSRCPSSARAWRTSRRTGRSSSCAQRADGRSRSRACCSERLGGRRQHRRRDHGLGADGAGGQQGRRGPTARDSCPAEPAAQGKRPPGSGGRRSMARAARSGGAGTLHDRPDLLLVVERVGDRISRMKLIAPTSRR